MKKLPAASLALVLVASASTASAYCPCYTLSSSSNTHDCGIEAVPGTNPSPAEWQDIFALVAKGPAAWGDKGPTVPDIGQGCGKPQPITKVPARFPCEILKAIAMVESGWKQFCPPELPADQKGKSSRTIISFDCGYGIGQVTSGMHKGETPNFDRERVASDPTYNMATGTRILAGKWLATNCVGDNQPSIVEHWYTATWAYNGLAWSNNPNNPNLDPNRDVYDPKVGGSYTYQEKVFGRVEHPPSAEYWPSVSLAYPDRSDCGDKGSPPDLPEPDCASPTNCSNKRSTHPSLCFDQGQGGSGQGGSGASGQGGSDQAGSGGSLSAGSGGSPQAGSGGSPQAGSGGSTAGSGGSVTAGSGGSEQAGSGGSPQAGSGGQAQAGSGGASGAGASGGSSQGGQAGSGQAGSQASGGSGQPSAGSAQAAGAAQGGSGSDSQEGQLQIESSSGESGEVESCGCRAAGRASTPHALGLLLGLAAARWRRRSSRGR